MSYQYLSQISFRFIVLGGGHLSGAEPLDDVFAYYYEDNKWEKIHTLPDNEHGYPKPRSCFGCVQKDDMVLISGGRHYDITVINEGLNDLWMFSVSKLQWNKLPAVLPFPTYFHTMVISPSGYLYMYGGITEHDLRSDKLFKARIFFPKLTELCWETITSVTNHLHKLPQDMLIDLGIPYSFIERLK